MNARITEVIEKAIEDQKKANIKKPTLIKTKADEVYHKRISYLISLITPLIVAPLPNGEILTRYPIEDSTHREQVEDWIMQLTKKHLKV